MTKKILALLGALVLVSALFISCGSEPEVKEPVATATPAPQIIGKEGIPMPAWVNTTPKDAENFYAVGYAKKSSKQISITAAEQDARDQISRWIGTSVKNALTNYTNESGEGANIQTLTYFENISKQVSDQTVVGVERNEVWVDQDGGVYVLEAFPKANMNKSFEEVSNTFVRNEAAAFSEFKAKDALTFLEKETKDGVK
jgi:hypothetical protein